jgi:hypothetical protein
MAERGHQLDHVARQRPDVVAAFRLLGEPDAALIDGDHLEIVGQHRHDQAPRVPGLRPTVHQQQRRTFAARAASRRTSPVSTSRLVNVSAKPAGRFGAPETDAGPRRVGGEAELMTISFGRDAGLTGRSPAVLLRRHVCRKPWFETGGSTGASTVAKNPGRGDTTTRMIEVGTYATRSDAELAQATLAAAGIPSVIAADDAGGAYPFDLSGGARVLVDEVDAEDAAAVLSTASR